MAKKFRMQNICFVWRLWNGARKRKKGVDAKYSHYLHLHIFLLNGHIQQPYEPGISVKPIVVINWIISVWSVKLFNPFQTN